MIRHYTPLVHRCDARCVTVTSACNAFTPSVDRHDLCARCDGYADDHAEPVRVPEWVRRAQSATLPPKLYR